MLTLLICPPGHAEFRRHITRVITLHITLHQNVFSDLDLLLSGCAIVFRKNAEFPKIEIKYLTSNPLDPSKFWSTPTWPSTTQLTNGPWFFSPLKMERVLPHPPHNRNVCVLAVVREAFQKATEPNLIRNHKALSADEAQSPVGPLTKLGVLPLNEWETSPVGPTLHWTNYELHLWCVDQ